MSAGWDARVIGVDAPGTCHLVGCPDKGVHPPHGIGTPASFDAYRHPARKDPLAGPLLRIFPGRHDGEMRVSLDVRAGGVHHYARAYVTTDLPPDQAIEHLLRVVAILETRLGVQI